MSYPRKCDNCLEKFSPYRPWQRFCCHECKDAFHAAERRRVRRAIRRKKWRKKKIGKRAPRCQINAEATLLVKELMRRHGYGSPSEVVIAAVRLADWPSTRRRSRGTARRGVTRG